MYMRWNLGVSFGYGGSSKIIVGGLVKSHDFYFAHFINILQDICSKLTMYMRIIISLHNQSKILRKSYALRFFSKKVMFANFRVYFQYIKICEGTLTLWRHSDIIWSSMVLILVSMDRGGPYLYTGSKYSGIKRSVQKIQGGGCNNAPFGECVTKNTSGGRDLKGHWTNITSFPDIKKKKKKKKRFFYH